MYLLDSQIQALETRYGIPAVRRFLIPSTAEDLARIRATQKHGRNHDVTVYIRRGEHYVVIAKHPYPPGLYRAPSGGIDPGEDIETGTHREIAEECGCTIALRRFLLRTEVSFTAPASPDGASQALLWRSFVFLADYLAGDMRFTDTHEIREVKLALLAEFEEYSRIMRASASAGLLYRAQLHDAILPLLPD